MMLYIDLEIIRGCGNVILLTKPNKEREFESLESRKCSALSYSQQSKKESVKHQICGCRTHPAADSQTARFARSV